MYLIHSAIPVYLICMKSSLLWRLIQITVITKQKQQQKYVAKSLLIYLLFADVTLLVCIDLVCDMPKLHEHVFQMSWKCLPFANTT